MEEKKICPYCGKEILAVAKKCKHCGEWLNIEGTKKEKSQKNIYYTLIGLLIIAVIAGIVIFIGSSSSESETKRPKVEIANLNDEDNSNKNISDIVDEEMRSIQDEESNYDNQQEQPSYEEPTDASVDDMLETGKLYEEAEDYAKAFTCYERAAQAGSSAGLNKLGNMYANGKGCVKDDYKAAKYYEAAAEKGNKYAQHNIGFCYWDGKGVAQNKETAKMWLRRSAAQGYEPAIKFCKREHIDL